MARISPLSVAQWSPAMEGALAAFRQHTSPGSPKSPGSPAPATPKGRNPGNLLSTFACYPELAEAYLTFNGYVLFASTLTPRLRELLVLRVAVIRKCEYVWAQHVPRGADAGLTAEEIGRIVEGPERPGWDALGRSALRAVDELLDNAEVSDATWAELALHLNERQLMDLVFAVGAYETLAMAIRSFGVDPDADIVANLPITTGAWRRNGRQPSEGDT